MSDLVTPDELTKPFWDGCRSHQLLAPRCDVCTRWFFVPEVCCPSCRSQAWSWAPSTGLGRLHSFSVVHRPPHPFLPTPYVLAAVELDEGWSMLTNLVEGDPDSIVCDMRVAVRFIAADDELTVPCFAPEPDGAP